MSGWKKYNLLKRHFVYKDDENFFNAYNTNDFHQPIRNLNPDIGEIQDVNNAVKHLSEAQKVLEWITTDDESVNDDIKRALSLIDDAERELNNTPSTISELVNHVSHLETWGDDWKYIALEFFHYMLQEYPDKIDEIGIVKRSIDENLIKSISGIDKFKL